MLTKAELDDAIQQYQAGEITHLQLLQICILPPQVAEAVNVLVGRVPPKIIERIKIEDLGVWPEPHQVDETSRVSKDIQPEQRMVRQVRWPNDNAAPFLRKLIGNQTLLEDLHFELRWPLGERFMNITTNKSGADRLISLLPLDWGGSRHDIDIDGAPVQIMLSEFTHRSILELLPEHLRPVPNVPTSFYVSCMTWGLT